MWLYIVCKCGNDWLSNSGETFAYFCTFVKKLQKGHIRPIISELARPISTLYSALGGDDFSDVCFEIAQPVNLGHFCKHRN